MSVHTLRVVFEADLVVEVDEYERSTNPGETWDDARLAEAVQSEIGHTGVSVRSVTGWDTA